MPYIDVVTQFVSQTATVGKLSFADTSNFNANDNNTATWSYVLGNEDTQTATLSVPAMDIPGGAILDGVQAIVRAGGNSGGGAQINALVNGSFGPTTIPLNGTLYDTTDSAWGSPTDPNTLGLTIDELRAGGEVITVAFMPDIADPLDTGFVDCVTIRAWYTESGSWRDHEYRERPFRA